MPTNFELSQKADLLAGQPMFVLLSKVKELEKAGKKIYHFEMGDPDFDTPENITDAMIKSVRSGKTHYTDSAGLPSFREAIRTSVEKTHGFLPDVSQTMALPGAHSAIYMAACLTCNPGDDCIVPDPCFPSYISVLKFLGVNRIGIPLREENDFGWDIVEFEKSVTEKTKLIILNFPNNPTGANLAPGDIKKIYKIAKETGAYILSDEVYSHMIYDGTPFTSPAFYDKCLNNVIMLNSFSKEYAMTGWRQGYAVGPQAIIGKMSLLVQTINSCVSPFLQEACIVALNDDIKEVNAMVLEYKKRRDIMVEMLNDIKGVDCKSPKGTFYCFPNIKGTGLTSKGFAEKALDAGVALLPGTDFGEYGEGYARLCFANSTENIESAMVILKKAFA